MVSLPHFPVQTGLSYSPWEKPWGSILWWLFNDRHATVIYILLFYATTPATFDFMPIQHSRPRLLIRSEAEGWWWAKQMQRFCLSLVVAKVMRILAAKQNRRLISQGTEIAAGVGFSVLFTQAWSLQRAGSKWKSCNGRRKIGIEEAWPDQQPG